MELTRIRWRTVTAKARAVALVAAGALTVGSLGCAGAGRESATPLQEAQRAPDGLALLPWPAVLVASIDARSALNHPTLGPELRKLAAMVSVAGEGSAFVPERDIDRLVLASYSVRSVDVAAVMLGRFDPERMVASVRDGSALRAGSPPVTVASHGTFTVMTSGGLALAVLSKGHAVGGTDGAVRRVLDRISAGQARRDIPEWVAKTVETPGAFGAMAVDLSSQPMGGSSLGGLPLGFLKGLRKVQMVGRFAPPGLEVAANLEYADPAAQRSGAEASLKGAARVASMLASSGVAPRIDNFQTTATDAGVDASFVIDAAQLESFLRTLPSVLGK